MNTMKYSKQEKTKKSNEQVFVALCKLNYEQNYYIDISLLR